ncbi:MAG TPA: DUF6262 family protein [Acidobacteriota bacterium]|nr:DUF6262 family protein [Acidobacteriota bacterium]HNG95647.1 DUF6262 family protein [Acidobacteriota bacterium]
MTSQRKGIGLIHHAQQKHQKTLEKAEAAISLLLKNKRPVNFNTVAQTAEVSSAWLYRNQIIRERILHLRGQKSVQATARTKEPASAASQLAMIEGLKQRVKSQQEQIQQLKKQLEVAYGLLQEAGIKTNGV